MAKDKFLNKCPLCVEGIDEDLDKPCVDCCGTGYVFTDEGEAEARRLMLILRVAAQYQIWERL